MEKSGNCYRLVKQIPPRDLPRGSPYGSRAWHESLGPEPSRWLIRPLIPQSASLQRRILINSLLKLWDRSLDQSRAPNPLKFRTGWRLSKSCLPREGLPWLIVFRVGKATLPVLLGKHGALKTPVQTDFSSQLPICRACGGNLLIGSWQKLWLVYLVALLCASYPTRKPFLF